jgi:predicted Na+-dependent transporter
MNHPVIFLVFLLLTAASTIAQDDITSTVSNGGSPAAAAAAAVGRIIGGNDVPFGTYPWFAKARMGNDWGGMFISVVLLQHLFFLLCFFYHCLT